MEKFLKSKQYKEMKVKYEKEYFKLGGEYAWYDGDKIEYNSTNKIAEHFKNKKVTIELERETPDGEIVVTKKTKTFYQVWSEDPKMKEYNEVVFDCNLSKVKPYQFNLFDGFAIQTHKIVDKIKAKAGLQLINDHISILCSHNKDHIRLMKWFYAQMLQQPHIIPNLCLVVISKEGVGKDMFYELNESVLGEKYCFNVDKLDSIVGKFNSTIGGKLLGVNNEQDPVDSQKRRDSIKYIVTAKKVMIEKKCKDPVKSTNYCRMVFYANRLTAFPVEDGGRRPYIMYSSSEKLPKYIGAKESKQYFDNLGKAIADPDVQKAYYDELMKIDVDSFNPKDIEKSELHKTLEDSAKSPIIEFLSEIVYSKKHLELYKVKTVDLLKQYTEFMKERNMRFEVSQKSFNSELQHEFKVRKYESCGINKFELNISDIKKYLETEYKCMFNCTDEDKEKDMTNEELDENIEQYKRLLEKMEKVKKLRAEKALTEQKIKVNSKYFTEPLIDHVEDEDKRTFSKFPYKTPVCDENDDETPKKIETPNETFGKIKKYDNSTDMKGRLVPKVTRSKDLPDNEITSPFDDYR